MTLKKSLISIVASTAIIATITGCSSNGTTAATTTTTTSVSNVAADEYILNAVGTATYLDDTNASQTVSLDRNTSSTNVVSGAKSLGDAEYTVNDANSSLAIRYRTLTSVAAPAVDANDVAVDLTYIDVDASGDYNASVDDTTTFAVGETLNAVGSAGVISLFTEMVFQQTDVQAQLNDLTTDVNQTVIDNATAAIAAGFGMTADQIENVDPTSLAVPYFVNAQLGACTTAELRAIGAGIVTNSATATDLAGIYTNMVAYTPAGATKTAFTTTQAQITAGTLTDANIASYSPASTRLNSGTPIVATASSTVATGFTAIDTAAYVNTGDKIAVETDTVITFVKPDANSTTAGSLVMRIANPKANNGASAEYSEMAIKISGVDINNTIGSVSSFSFDPDTATVNYSWKNVDVNTSLIANFTSATDVNASALGIEATMITGGTIDTDAIFTALDDNVTSENNLTADITTEKLMTTFANTVHTRQVLLDLNTSLISSVQTPVGTTPTTLSTYNQTAWPSMSIAGASSVVTGSGILLVNNATVDARTAVVTGLNIAPDNTLKIDTVLDDNDATTATITINTDENASVQVLKTTVQTYEENTTVEFTFAGGISDLNTSGVASQVVADNTADTSVVSNAIHATTDVTTPNIDVNGTLGYTITDEFGSSEAKTANIRINRAPTALTLLDFNYTVTTGDIVTTVASSGGADMNTSAQTADGSAIELDNVVSSIVDPDLTDANKTKLTFVAVSDTTNCDISTPNILNCSAANDGNFTITSGTAEFLAAPDLNLTYDDGVASVIAVEVTVRATDENGLYKDTNLTINQ